MHDKLSIFEYIDFYLISISVILEVFFVVYCNYDLALYLFHEKCFEYPAKHILPFLSTQRVINGHLWGFEFVLLRSAIHW